MKYLHVIMAVLVLAGGIAWSDTQTNQKTWTVPGRVRTTWVGNSFKGESESSQVGRWVQNNIDEIEVTPDGTVITASGFDENGRCTGLYKDGACNTQKVRQYNGAGGHIVWGWGTASSAAAAWGDEFFIANTNGDLMRFRWTPGMLNSHEFIDQARYCAGEATENRSKQFEADNLTAVGLAVRDGLGVLVQASGAVQVWDMAEPMVKLRQFQIENARDAAIATDQTLWFVADGKIVQVTDEGMVVRTIDDFDEPTAVHISPDGRLVVCDNGGRRQVLVYDISSEPTLIATHGVPGGIRAGTPGHLTPHTFYGLRGANFDAAGNLYVAFDMGFGGAGTTIRSFSLAGEVRWDLKCLAFVDCFDVDPAGDGETIYTSQEIISFDPDAPDGQNWTHTAMTVDPHRYPDDNRRSGGIQIQRVQGQRLLARYTQMGGGPFLYAFEDENSQIARPAGRFGWTYDEDKGKDRGHGWAWYVDEQGSVWSGDTSDPKKTIKRWRLLGWNEDGTPRYDKANPDIWPWPEGWTELKRIVYVPETDTLYLSGYTPEQPRDEHWGAIGYVLARYDNWTGGEPNKRYEIEDLPRDLRPLPPKAIAVAGDYIFAVMCWHSGEEGQNKLDGKPLMVHVYRADDGSSVGNMWGPWKPLPIVDTKRGINVFQRSSGEYMILVEEVYRGKNIMYIWTPADILLRADLDNDGTVGLGDFVIMSAQWLRAGCIWPEWCHYTSMNREPIVLGMH